MLGTSARLLRLLTLLQTRRSWTGGELTTRLDVTGRTLRRDIDRLRSLGYPVHSTSGVAGGYQLGAGTELPPLLLDDEEALAVALGLRGAAAGGVSGLEEVALRALIKLEQVMPARLRRRVSALHEAIVPLGRGGPTVDAATLSVLATACRDHQRLQFAYQGLGRGPEQGNGGAKTDRSVEPSGLVHTGLRWYLVAWDLGRGDWRTFRADRIAGTPTAGETFFPRSAPEGGLAAYVARSVSLNAYPVRARVLLHAPIAEMAKRITPATGTLESVGPRSCRLLAGAPSVEGLAIWMAALGVEFEIEDPPAARESLRALAARVERAAQTPAAQRPAKSPVAKPAAAKSAAAKRRLLKAPGPKKRPRR